MKHRPAVAFLRSEAYPRRLASACPRPPSGPGAAAGDGPPHPGSLWPAINKPSECNTNILANNTNNFTGCLDKKNCIKKKPLESVHRRVVTYILQIIFHCKILGIIPLVTSDLCLSTVQFQHTQEITNSSLPRL